MVKRLRHRPFTAVTRVRFPSGSPRIYAYLSKMQNFIYFLCAGVAQLVEQLICNQQVGGSSPSTSSSRVVHSFTQWVVSFIICRCVGIGRRDRLKICYPQGCVGSSPTTGTITKYLSISGVLRYFFLLVLSRLYCTEN